MGYVTVLSHLKPALECGDMANMLHHFPSNVDRRPLVDPAKSGDERSVSRLTHMVGWISSRCIPIGEWLVDYK